MGPPAPPDGTVEAWALDLITTTDPGRKLAPGRPPARWEDPPVPRRVAGPGRPAGWEVADRAPRSVRKGALGDAARRCELFHTFLHHELQAAELMAWALLAFADAPREFKKGLLAVLLEELEHMGLYRGYLEARGVAFGDLEIRDWFWTRVPQVRTPAEFVAVMGLGLEGGNLDHSDRYATWFREAGDEEAARVLERVRDEEVGHVRFAVRWFRELTGGLDFDAWVAALPEPLTPKVFQGRPLNRRDRERAGMDDAFLAGLARW